MSKRTFDIAIARPTSSSGPASGSQHDHALYGGSRRLNMRYEYNEDSPAAFVELYPSWIPTIEEIKDVLKKVPGVTMVEWQTIKVCQGIVGSFYSARNVLVHTSIGPGSASPPIEFELTRHMHMKDKRVPFTVTALFKDPPKGLIPEAWGILLHATDGKQLSPMHVQEYW